MRLISSRRSRRARCAAAAAGVGCVAAFVAGFSYVPDPCGMLDLIDPNPGAAVLKILGAIAIVALSIAVWFQLNQRVRAHGGGVLAGLAVGIGIALLLTALVPSLFSFEVGIVVLVAVFVALYRPEHGGALHGRAEQGVVRAPRGPRAGGPRRGARRAAGGAIGCGDRVARRWPVRDRDAGDPGLPLARAPDAVRGPHRSGAGLGPCPARRGGRGIAGARSACGRSGNARSSGVLPARHPRSKSPRRRR